jgi:hypothetical protein
MEFTKNIGGKKTGMRTLTGYQNALSNIKPKTLRYQETPLK